MLRLECAAVLAAVIAVPAHGQDLERARMLYDNHCRMCHDSIAFERTAKIATNYAQIKAQVARWQTNTGLRWSEQDIDGVTAYLAKMYYKYPVPGEGD